MGADGGSFAKRDDLIKTKKAAEHADQHELQRLLWHTCALSNEPLRQPVVSCALGKLYNKEALIAHLLDPASGSDGHAVASHIRSLKDVTTLKLTTNPALGLSRSPSSRESAPAKALDSVKFVAPFVCPISLREMNGSTKFVYQKPGGYVISEASLKELCKAGAEATLLAEFGTSSSGDASSEQWIIINPRADELEAAKAAWEAEQACAKDMKRRVKASKRKTGEDTVPLHPKKGRPTEVAATAGPSIKAGSSVALLSSSLAAKLAAEKKALSPAIASLYVDPTADPNHDKDGRSTWMTRGAFTRYAG
ncbi:BQ2448_7417 [Microbotryum intermedium]|uniref:BQ2448_7417 protein n=1 Tax=Microbotryum intermedium TaxID=269621 RepID=A0A238FMW6_9BASI|nr:BQ2448_7417 [Microbotryum intermedium]